MDKADCSECESRQTCVRKMEMYHFQYGAPSAVTLKVVIPMWTCDRCGTSYRKGHESEEIIDAAVNTHLRSLERRRDDK